MKYTALAKRWTGGWELHVEGVGVTQVRRLEDADAQVRSFLETLNDADLDDQDVIEVIEAE